MTPLPRLRVPLSAYVVDCAVYVDGVRLPGRFTHDRALAEVRRRGDGFVWIGLHEPDQEQITGIAEVFGLHELAVEDAVHAHQRPKLERYDETLFMVLKTVRYCGGETSALDVVETGEVMVFLGRDFVITVRHGDHSGLHDVRLRLEADPEQLALGPADLVVKLPSLFLERRHGVARRGLEAPRGIRTLLVFGRDPGAKRRRLLGDELLEGCHALARVFPQIGDLLNQALFEPREAPLVLPPLAA